MSDPLHHCEICDKPIFPGDPVYISADPCAFCEEHAPSLQDAVLHWRRDLTSDDPEWPDQFGSVEEVEAIIEGLEAEIAEKGNIKRMETAA